MKRLLFAAALVASLAACDACHHPGGETPESSPADCTAACDRMRELKCPEGDPLAGETCEQLCNELGPLLNPSCVAGAADVDAARACGVRCIP